VSYEAIGWNNTFRTTAWNDSYSKISTHNSAQAGAARLYHPRPKLLTEARLKLVLCYTLKLPGGYG